MPDVSLPSMPMPDVEFLKPTKEAVLEIPTCMLLHLLFTSAEVQLPPASHVLGTLKVQRAREAGPTD